MTSKLPHPREAFVWTWLPGAVEPVVAGRLVSDGERLQFVYGRSYRESADAIALYLPELPLGSGPIAPLGTLPMASAIRDGSPRSEEHTSELQSLMRNSYATFCCKKKNT